MQRLQRLSARLAAQQQAGLAPAAPTAKHYSIFDYFKKKTDEEEKTAQAAQQPAEEAPSELQAEPVASKKKIPDSTLLKREVASLQREGEENLFGRHQASRKSVRDRNQSLEELLHPGLAQNARVSIEKYSAKSKRRGLQADLGEHPFPVTPRVGPYEVAKPIFGAKNYFWCACGMSKTQPFCDSSHVGTQFKPLKFSLDTPVEAMQVCGCKLTSNAPFCDGKTCKALLSGDFDSIPSQSAAEQLDSQAQQGADQTPPQH